MRFVDKKVGTTSKYVNIHSGHRARLRNNLVSSRWEIFDEHQILEYILSIVIPRKDTNPIAHELINSFGSLANVLDASVDDLKTVKGVGDVAATFLSSIPSIFKHYKASKLAKKPELSSPAKIFEYYGNVFNHMASEEFHILCLDQQGTLIVKKVLAMGSNNEVSFSLKSITEVAVRSKASAVVLVHNHPNGDVNPSAEDIEMTKQIYLNLIFNRVLVLDHIIVGKYDGEYYSFKNAGLIDKFSKDAESVLGRSPILASNYPKYNKDKK